MQEAAAAGFPPQYWAETVDVQDPKHRLMPIPQDGGDDEPLAEIRAWQLHELNDPLRSLCAAG
jgi:hypothetical protein